MFVSCRQRRADDLQFYIDGKAIRYSVNEYTHLGHVISARMEDKSDIHLTKNSLCGKINNLLCYFSHCDPFVKVQYYCCDLYGGVQCAQCSGAYLNQMLKIYMYSMAQRVEKGLGLLYHTHSALLYRISNILPLKY